MHRTQIYLDDEIYSFLENEKKTTHLSYSEIIRSSVKKSIQISQSTLISRMEKAAGSWKDPLSPEDYVSQLRKDRPL